MKAVDTNVLLYAHRKESPHHKQAFQLLQGLSEGAVSWAIPWPCVSEFLRVATHPRFYSPPTSLEIALQNIQSLIASPSLTLLSETERHEEILFEILKKYDARGNHIFDAKIYTLCREHGISEILTADTDFLKFREIRITNPFLSESGV